MSESAIARQWHFDAPVVAQVTCADSSCIAATLGDGSVVLIDMVGEQDPQRIALHQGVSLTLSADCIGSRFLSGGDDGRLLSFTYNETSPQILAQQKGQWLDHVTASVTSQKRAYSFGKQVQIVDARGQAQGKPLAHPSSVGGLAFSPNGKRLAASHYNGVSLWWSAPTETQTPVTMPWKGSHLKTCWLPDGKIVMTTMQDNSLHGWRLADMNEMQMQGYAGKIRSWDWTVKGRYLATAGADVVICWPYFGGGPWGKTPLQLGEPRDVMVTEVAAHPRDEMIAAGYADGMIIMAPLDGRGAIMVHPPIAAAGAAVTGLSWADHGGSLFASLESGYIMLFTVESVSRAVKAAGKLAGLEQPLSKINPKAP